MLFSNCFRLNMAFPKGVVLRTIISVVRFCTYLEFLMGTWFVKVINIISNNTKNKEIDYNIFLK